MPSIQERDGRFQLRVKHKLLPKPYFSTFDTYAEAEAYGAALTKRLKAGIVPAALAQEEEAADNPVLPAVIRSYLKLAPVTDSDAALLSKVTKEVAGVRLNAIVATWVDEYVAGLKLADNVAPGTIRKKVGVLARVLDWHFRRATPKGEALPDNPFRKLPRGYSLYTREDASKLAAKDLAPKRDEHRDRRLLPSEEVRILAALDGNKSNGKGYPIMARPDVKMLFLLTVNTGLRLSEAYRLRVDQLDLPRGLIRVEGSKGHRGALKPRTVPLLPSLVTALDAFVAGRSGLVFPFWDGTAPGKKTATRDLVQIYIRLFRSACVDNLTEHDLRHEACCRWFEMRNANGSWKFSDVEICRIMGWSNYSMILRYASLRGEDMAARMAD